MMIALMLLAGFAFAPDATPAGMELDLPRLRETLNDAQDSRGQSQAALLLVQSKDAGAEKIVRNGLGQTANEPVFLALAAAVRLYQDRRFTKELLNALTANRPRLRQVVAETLAVLADAALVRRLAEISGNDKLDLRVRQTAVWTLGRSGHKEAVAVLIARLDTEPLRRMAGLALAELTGQGLGQDVARWKAWWTRHKNMTAEQWLQMRLNYQSSRAQRLEGELQRAQTHILRLHQQLFARLPVVERVGYLQSLGEQDDPNVRGLAVIWSVELLPTADAARKKQLGEILLRLSNDGHLDVQRGALLGLGRIDTPAAFSRLQSRLKATVPGVRAAAVRGLAVQASGKEAAARAKLKKVIPLLQAALEDKSLEVVIEAGESLGLLGVPEAGPVLTNLLRHPSDIVRRTAAQSLERVADSTVLEDLLKGVKDPSDKVRFSLVGAIGRAAMGAKAPTADQRKRLLECLEGLLDKDTDQGVRSRAATVLGECAPPSCLAGMWKHVRADGGKVQEKAWDAFIEILVRGGGPALVEHWDERLKKDKQDSRRLQLLARVYARWDQLPEKKSAARKTLERLIGLHLDLGKYSAVIPLIQGMLTRTPEPDDPLRTRCLGWLHKAGELALSAGNRPEALRCVAEAKTHLRKGEKWGGLFDKLQTKAMRKE